MKKDAEDLSRFKQAQEYDYASALSEIRGGRKVSHWMWYVFPQLKGLGHSGMSEYYGIRDLEEAKEYLKDPILGKRLVEISEALLSLNTSDAAAVMGYPDCLKLRSSMTLFDAAAQDTDVFHRVLEKFYQGEADSLTLHLLGKER